MGYLGTGSELLNSHIENPDNISIGKYSTISRSKIKGPFGVARHSFISRCIIGKYVTIGSRCSVGAFNHPLDWLSTNEFQFKDMSPYYGFSIPEAKLCKAPSEDIFTTIKNDVWIGDNAILKQGITVETGCIIGAGSVLTKSTQPYCIYTGNPARPLKARFSEDIIQRLLATCWWDLSVEQISSIKFDNIEIALAQLEAILT